LTHPNKSGADSSTCPKREQAPRRPAPAPHCAAVLGVDTGWTMAGPRIPAPACGSFGGLIGVDVGVDWPKQLGQAQRPGGSGLITLGWTGVDWGGQARIEGGGRALMHANPQVRYRFQDRRLRPLGHPPGARVYPAATAGWVPDVPRLLPMDADV